MASKAARKTDFKTVRRLVERLGDRDKLRLLRDLEDEAWKRFGEAVDGMRAWARENPISDDEIRRECESVREELYQREQAEGRR